MLSSGHPTEVHVKACIVCCSIQSRNGVCQFGLFHYSDRSSRQHQRSNLLYEKSGKRTSALCSDSCTAAVASLEQDKAWILVWPDKDHGQSQQVILSSKRGKGAPRFDDVHTRLVLNPGICRNFIRNVSSSHRINRLTGSDTHQRNQHLTWLTGFERRWKLKRVIRLFLYPPPAFPDSTKFGH